MLLHSLERISDLPLDLSKLAQPKRIVVPILNKCFIYHKKRYEIEAEDGWALVQTENNRSLYLAQATPEDIISQGIDIARGYTHHNSIIFQNFDTAKRKWERQISAPLEFNNSLTFEAILAAAWEDGRFYWIEPNYNDIAIYDIKNAYDADLPLSNIKGVTPETRTLYLFHDIERQHVRKIVAEDAARKEHEKRLQDTPYRLKTLFERAGASLISYSVSGKRIVVDWNIAGQRHNYNSVIDADTWKILEAGYCMSNDDRRHNITSLVKTAEEYAERGLTYITRS